MKLRRLTTVGVGGSAPWETVDAPPAPMSTDGFFVNAADLAPVLADLPAVDAPTGFERLSLGVVLDVVRDLQVRRIPLSPGESHRLAYLSDGRFVCGEEAVSNYGFPHHTLDRRRLLITTCEALPSPVDHAQYKPHGRQTRVDAAKRDAVAVARWHAHADGRTWEAGTPPPETLEDGPLMALSARARRSIDRAIRATMDDAPRAALADGITLSFTFDGVPCGMNFTPWPPEHHIVVRVTDRSDPDDIGPWLDTVRRSPSGKVSEVVPS